MSSSDEPKKHRQLRCLLKDFRDSKMDTELEKNSFSDDGAHFDKYQLCNSGKIMENGHLVNTKESDDVYGIVCWFKAEVDVNKCDKSSLQISQKIQRTEFDRGDGSPQCLADEKTLYCGCFTSHCNERFETFEVV